MGKPSVTQLLDLFNKPGLIAWANTLGFQSIDVGQYKRIKMQEGTTFHRQIKKYIKEKTPFEDKVIQDRFDHFFKNFEIIGSEEKIETDYFTGRLDIRFKQNDLVCICDFKLNKSKVRFFDRLQLVAYRMATGADKLGIISIPKFFFFPVIIDDYKPYEQILINLSNIYSLMEETNERL